MEIHLVTELKQLATITTTMIIDLKHLSHLLSTHVRIVLLFCVFRDIKVNILLVRQNNTFLVQALGVCACEKLCFFTICWTFYRPDD